MDASAPAPSEPTAAAKDARKLVERDARGNLYGVYHDVYRDPEIYQRELKEIYGKTWVFVGLELEVPNPGDFKATFVGEIPVVLVRDENRKLHVFENVCLHRGAKLVRRACGNAKALTCMYHQWTYGLDGQLKRVHHEHGFPGLDKSEHGLVPVNVTERLGLVFITQDEPAASDATLDDWPALLGANHRLLDVRETEVPANWKIFLEGFLEGYHIRPAHPQTFYPYGYDNLNVVERMGPHSRITFPFRRIEALAQVKPEERRVDGLLTYVYHLFPNTFVTVLSHHTNLVVLEPIDIANTRLIIYTLANRADADGAQLAEKDRAFVDQTGAAEDRAIACAIQRGVGSGANTVFTFGKFESAIVNFHRTLDAALKGM